MRFLLPAFLAASFCAVTALGEEVQLSTVAGEASPTKRKYGPYVSVSAGETFGQDADVRIGSRQYPLESVSGSAIFSVEVGKSWKLKKLPVMVSVSADATFMSTTLRGSLPAASLPNASDVARYEADMNSLFFTLNGSLALDLYRYRARIGNILGGFRPYIGGGLGGGQVWYRNASALSRDQVGGGATAANATPFSIDEFTNAWNWYIGLEWTWKDRYSVFLEYRDFYFGDLEDMTNFSTDGYLLGFRYRY